MRPAPRPGLISAPEAVDLLLAGREPPAPRRMPLPEAVGRVLAEPLVAPSAVPSTAVALRDGWAVAAEATIGASAYGPAWLAEPPSRVRAGDALPAGADAVLPPGAVLVEAGIAQAVLAAAPGEGVRRRGEDFAAGAVLLEAGRIVSPFDAALARAAGLEACAVREPRVALLAPRGEGAGDLLAALAGAGGARVTRAADPDAVGEAAADLVLAVAGFAPPVAPLAGGLAIRPGEGAVPGWAGDVPALVVPPLLAAALGVGLLVLAPLLARLAGLAAPAPGRPGPLTRKVTSAIGLTEIVLLRREAGAWEPLAGGDPPLAALARAEAWIALPPECEGFPAGTPIEAQALPR